MNDTMQIDGTTFLKDYEIPKDDSIVWRFFELAKFIAMLKDSALFMTRADKFEDYFEGAVCSLEDSEKYDEALVEYYSDIIGEPVGEAFIETEHRAIQSIRKNSFLSCWYESPYESIAMWRLYASGHNSKGVAIKTTVGQLKKSIGQTVEIGRIKYIDYSEEWPDANEALWRKRILFEYEHEVRIRIITAGGLSPNPPEYRLLSVNLNDLIESVYVSPMAEPWFKEVVEDILNKYGLNKKVFHSSLDDKALF